MNRVKVEVTHNEAKNQVIVQTTTLSEENREERSAFFTPDQAVEMANALLNCAEICGVHVKVEVQPSVTPMQRTALINRAEIIMRSMSGKKANIIAAHIVDTVLNSVF